MKTNLWLCLMTGCVLGLSACGKGTLPAAVGLAANSQAAANREEQSHADSSLAFGPFQGIDLSVLSPSQRETITQASEDFDLVQKGKKPKHAARDKDAPLPADGGTEFFVGKGYKLTVMKSLSSFGGEKSQLTGYVYGPVISFPKSFAPGNASKVAALRFYTPEQLEKLLSSKYIFGF